MVGISVLDPSAPFSPTSRPRKPYRFLMITVISALGCLILGLFFLISRQKQDPSNPRKLPLPPGPKPDPLIGNVRHMPLDLPWVRFAEWRKIYGDMIHMKLLGDHILILNSYKSCMDLLGQKVIYASRPKFLLAKYMGMGELTTVQPYGDTFRRHRRLLHSALSKSAVAQFQPAQEAQTKWFLSTLTHDTKNCIANLRLLTGRTIVQATYGIEVKSVDDDYIVLAEEFIRSGAILLSPATNLWDAFPIFPYLPSWFPGAGIKQIAHQTRQIIDQMVKTSMGHVKAELATGEAARSLAANALESGDYAEEDIKWASAILYFAGADTTYGVLAAFIFFMIKHPEIQKKAQAEVDRVVGRGRMPTFEDRQQLPYIDCIIKEIIRWSAIAPAALPHCLTEDDYYNGYWIPAGTTVVANTWAISRDETLYKDPERFSPERFEGEAGKDAVDPFTFALGFGRRICPGLHFVNSMAFIVIASILAGYEISKPRDENGQEVEPRESYTPGAIRVFEHFDCTIKPRSA
ncbi:hypothetical protein BOTBODRAFT_191667 [Botryobasidium botryosum FD-172 SS1]|uniref:Cytochrome P450 n=1 Tax=Botryobasidium botryosum (strain FD-172 SS1) TaxID=930990 RepID=A0A067MA94_BOTB1|nr:hypothetical protein BOTBODRAFT_191667 [Botryobasidium botryosum FD-172 SS1]